MRRGMCYYESNLERDEEKHMHGLMFRERGEW